MPEIIIDSSRAWDDAISMVTKNEFRWEFRGWTTNHHHLWNGEPVYTGMKGVRFHPALGEQSFTIRHDYDYALGLKQNGGKGYHVNVELPREKYAFVTSLGKGHAEDCWKMLSERVTNDGDNLAAQWFMAGVRY